MKIILPGNPQSTNNIYKQHGHIRFMMKRAKVLKESYQWEAKNQWRKPILVGDLKIKLELYFGDKRKRDWDNFHKLTMDALTGIVWEDDSQIREATVKLFYDKENPRTEIEIL
jgi:crossover junction endodeoxyribonuclease RusA